MAIAGRNKRSKRLLLPRTSLASVESLTMPLECRCFMHPSCAHASLVNCRSTKLFLLADFQCEECQKRVADIVSRMNGETESVVVSVLEKKVTLTCRSYTTSVVKAPTQQVMALYQKSIARLFRYSCS
ncbi:hypothetical protein Acr_25g0005330 [Actinidia rufa]|uniref:Heavy metal transport/detoxification superfamily protein n=1 Tax=Actinidia rufa TaxID=165716 RepID=A0A7J0H019_9ERIC|nr:hypothetical protein Acr_25g0005330 [Actinidia rufa]